MDIYLPNENTREKHSVMIYAHGGGFIFCGKVTGDAIEKESSGSNDVQGIFK